MAHRSPYSEEAQLWAPRLKTAFICQDHRNSIKYIDYYYHYIFYYCIYYYILLL
jgi:hypothetical protein